MEKGFYWLQHNGRIQVAYYTDGVTDDLETGQLITGVWHLTQREDICHNGEAEVIEGLLPVPFK
ncbi:TPA: hypothetical protein JG926_004544 [Enterobacter hormaechei subsp. steigerwaltii]|jgi:hypothetical protein|uniref:hypothetical protein n=1 Tax=Enterobacter cloacae complex TaxID=354276 RepID=UPI0007B3CFD9|nr:hypothetical protein [Enterobacter hormaechei]EKY3879190.1 hypothetical protein [Enterobacter hormaechei]ELC6546341.1 hypothetical protein [Enterobacter hormaechei]ELC6561117.1 hypothetical protein [Enterobacter hormaechei]KZR01625.1 hypothetical protein A3N59_04325 [Enterobacter hormaechei subsp. steigerwaltii]MCM7446970.1 hypothetical protein [Enterobacter hormaechei]